MISLVNLYYLYHCQVDVWHLFFKMSHFYSIWLLFVIIRQFVSNSTASFSIYVFVNQPHLVYEFMILVILRAYTTNLSKIFGFLAKYFYAFSAIIPRKIAISSWLANETPFSFDGEFGAPFRNLDLCI